jgi:molybdopterin/thiamine biosynthesis adenylyltransferase
MKALILPAPVVAELRRNLFATGNETCAILLTFPGQQGRILARDLIPVPEGAYNLRSPVAAELKSEFLFEVAERARRASAGLLFIHTHPQSIEPLEFSPADREGEEALKPYLDLKIPERQHTSLVITEKECRARLICGEELQVREIGARIDYLFDPDRNTQADCAEIYDRQVRVIGAAGQRLIARAKVGLVGLGGTGSIVAQELAYLGVGDFVLIDHDLAETSNRNRVVGTEPDDIGRPKVEIAARLIQKANPSAKVECVDGSVMDGLCQQRLGHRDFIFICTDNHSSRLEVCRFCYRHLIPAIDIGVGLAVQNGALTSISGRVQMIAPGLPCLLCTGSISSDALRRETMSPEHKSADPYFGVDGEPQPAVISLNGTMSSLAVTMFMSAVAGLPVPARHLRYDGLAATVRPVVATADPDCAVCSHAGELALGLTSGASH